MSQDRSQLGITPVIVLVVARLYIEPSDPDQGYDLVTEPVDDPVVRDPGLQVAPELSPRSRPRLSALRHVNVDRFHQPSLFTPLMMGVWRLHHGDKS